MYLLIVLVLVLMTIHYCTQNRHGYKFSNGPFALPLIGNLHQFGKSPSIQFSKWVAKYGKLYTIYFGRQPAVVISDTILMKKLFGRPESTEKFPTLVFDVLFLRGGIGYSNGKVWQEQRTFFVKCLRKLESSPRFETFVNHEVAELGDWFEDKMRTGEKVFLPARLNAFTSNIICACISGSREETVVSEIMEDWVKALNRVTSTGVAFFASIGKLAPEMSGLSEYRKCCDRLRQFCKGLVDKERSELHHDNVITSYLHKVENTKNKSSSFYGEGGYEYIVEALLGMMLGGTETTATTLNWALFYLCAFPEIQTKVHLEIDQIGREVGLSDRKDFKYTEAFIEETLRMSSTLPFGILHVLEDDLEWKEWRFKKGTVLVPNIYHVHNDSSIWGDPEVFRPERFLEGIANGQDLRDLVMTFQAGRRKCPGANMSKDVLFLAVCNLVKRFSFGIPSNEDCKQYLACDMGFVSVPKHVPILIHRRE